MRKLFFSIADIPMVSNVVETGAADGSPFLCPEWFHLFEQYLISDGKAPRYYAASGACGLQGILPMISNRGPAERATKLRSMSNYYTGYFSPLRSRDGASVNMISDLMRVVSQEEPACWQLDFTPILHGSALWNCLQTGLSVNGWYLESYYVNSNWILEIGGICFERYWGERPSRLRSTFQRRSKKLRNDLGYEFLLIKESGDDVEFALTEFSRIYSLSWKTEEPHQEFIAEWCRGLAEKQQLRLGLLYASDKIIAAQIWITDKKTAYIFKLAHDPSFSAYSPGTILMHDLIRHAIDIDHVERVDFLSGDDAYKKDWMNSRRELWGVRAYNQNLLIGRFSAWFCRLRKLFKRVI